MIISGIESNLQAVRQRIATALQDVASEPQLKAPTAELIAVSKTVSVENIAQAIECGQTHFAENYIQEAIEKIKKIKNIQKINQPYWHFIGAIQNNKTRWLASHFDWVHSVESYQTAYRLSQQRKTDQTPLQICLQINIDEEASKAGLTSQEILPIALAIQKLPNICLRGLMSIPKPRSQITEQRKPFAQLRSLAQQLNQQGTRLDTLSMGMSADLEAAIHEGSTMLRIGSAIFGERKNVKQ